MLCKATQEACERDMYVRMQSLLQYVLQGTGDINPAVTPRSPQTQADSCCPRKKDRQVTEDSAWDKHRGLLPGRLGEGGHTVRDCELESCFSRASLEAASLAFSCPKPSRACTCTHQLARVSCSMPKQLPHGPGIPEKACKSSLKLCLSQGIQCIFLPNRHMSKCM